MTKAKDVRRNRSGFGKYVGDVLKTPTYFFTIQKEKYIYILQLQSTSKFGMVVVYLKEKNKKKKKTERKKKGDQK